MSLPVFLLLGLLCIFLFIFWQIKKSKQKKVPTKIIKPFAFENATIAAVKAENTNDDFTFNSVEIASPFLESFSNFKVLTEQEALTLSKENTQKITKNFQKPHPLLLPLTRGSFEPNELFDLIRTDAQMTAKILKVVNSPLFSLQQPITSINHAIIFLGVGAVKSIAMQYAVESAIKTTDVQPLQEAAFHKLWTASYMASAICSLIAKHLGKENSAELATHCLLSYLGGMAIVSHDEKVSENYLDKNGLYQRVDKAQSILQTNSAIIGKKIAQQWQLPASIVDAIKYSLHPLTLSTLEADVPAEKIADVLICYVSCRLADCVAFHKMTDISQLEQLLNQAENGVNFYYIKNKLAEAGLTQLNTLLLDANFKRKINAIIEQVNI